MYTNRIKVATSSPYMPTFFSQPNGFRNFLVPRHGWENFRSLNTKSSYFSVERLPACSFEDLIYVCAHPFSGSYLASSNVAPSTVREHNLAYQTIGIPIHIMTPLLFNIFSPLLSSFVGADLWPREGNKGLQLIDLEVEVPQFLLRKSFFIVVENILFLGALVQGDKDIGILPNQQPLPMT